jgi:type VI secretion system protein ImpM
MTRLPGDARWKLNYDAMAPVSFAFVGPGRRHALAGHLVASHDRSGRRYPFLTMRKLDVPDPAAFAS